MSIEALGPELHSNQEIAWGVEMAVRAIARIRLLLGTEYEKLGLERQTDSSRAELAPHIKRRIQELENELKNALEFLKEFDPQLYMELKKQ